MRVRLATRGSELARWQANRVVTLLEKTYPHFEFEVIVVKTSGDKNPATSISEIGGQGFFVAEIQSAVLEGRADIAVHSAKDLPSVELEGLTLAAIPERGDPRDALVGCYWADLPNNAVIASGSIRRRSHLAHLRPDLLFKDLRGNIKTRLDRASDVDAIVVAKVALDRLNLSPPLVDPLDPDLLLPQVAQGALAVECRSVDSQMIEILKTIEDPVARRMVDAERAFLAAIGSGCNFPVAAYAQPSSREIDAELKLIGAISSVDGSIYLREERLGSNGIVLGQEVANYLLKNRCGQDVLGNH